MHDIKEQQYHIYLYIRGEPQREEGRRHRRHPRRERISVYAVDERYRERAVAVDEAWRDIESPSVERFRERDRTEWEMRRNRRSLSPLSSLVPTRVQYQLLLHVLN